MINVLKKALVIALISTIFVGIHCMGQGSKKKSAYRCLKCHTDNLNLNKKYLHPMVKKGRCKACHDTYDEETHVQPVLPAIEVCLKCHPDEALGRSHPVGGYIVDQNTGGTMTCVSTCHVPHGSDYKFQTPYKNRMKLCLSCHDDF